MGSVFEFMAVHIAHQANSLKRIHVYAKRVLLEEPNAGTFRPLLLPRDGDIPMGLVISNQVGLSLQDIIGY